MIATPTDISLSHRLTLCDHAALKFTMFAWHANSLN